MTWKRGADGTYTRSCSCCGGTGKERLANTEFCQCPWDDTEDVDHPANSSNDVERDRFGGIGFRVVRCNRCGTYWMMYYEIGDDSWDVPGPENLGHTMPAEDWRSGKKE